MLASGNLGDAAIERGAVVDVVGQVGQLVLRPAGPGGLP